MASTPFTLAALATSAVAGLQVVTTREHTAHGSGQYHSAVLITDRGEVLVRVPKNANAEITQSGELLAMTALTEGARAQLPFEVPQTLGMTRARDTRAVVTTYIAGTIADDEMLAVDSDLIRSVAESIAAIHQLPPSLVQHAGLPMRTAADIRTQIERLVDRTADTGLLPETVRRRWVEVLEVERLWGFEPAVVHGSLSAEQLVTEDSQVVGVLGWSELALGDPASDLSWLFGIDSAVFEVALARYSNVKELIAQHDFVTRARFFHELEVAKWLLHGVDTHDQSIIDDAIGMLDGLVDSISLFGASSLQLAATHQQDVNELLDATPDVSVDWRSETAEFEALDEDRMFSSDFSGDQRAHSQDDEHDSPQQ